MHDDDSLLEPCSPVMASRFLQIYLVHASNLTIVSLGNHLSGPHTRQDALVPRRHKCLAQQEGGGASGGGL